MFILPEDFTPTPRTIIIGRGRVVKQHPANQQFDSMVAGIAAEYSAAACKGQKGSILSKLIERLHTELDGFVKKDPSSGRWLRVDESLARTTTAQALRNLLSTNYRSSKQFKQKRRLEQIKQQQKKQQKQQKQEQAQNITLSSSLLEFHMACSVSRPSSASSDDEVSFCSLPASHSTSTSHSDSDSTCSSDTFSILFAAFGESTAPTSTASDAHDNFAPTPLGFDHSLLEPTPIKQQHQQELPAPESMLASFLEDDELLSCLL
ncbi:Nitrilase family, member 2 [Seminavis robusta]|uniref:Nitrilase family, member 2 n=1 Tax=Seminavis robusta TaxID=568900 RepID=A0A9N8D666_9STRA|nr:Nitrilase family, member 2 [Seminavis robusta]|eukprot:Sro10_g008150.1 Nitrilase family, member 2 (263) ;mRNA; r:141238-142026